MNRKQEIFKSILTSPYNNDNFVGFIREFLNNIELVAPNRYVEVKNNFSYYVNGYYHIGNYVSDDGDKIAVISVCLNRGDTVERARSMQRNFVKPLIECGGCAGALVAFYTKDEPTKWRLSFIRMDYEFSKGKVTEKLTPAKRYSYLVGKGEPCHTAQVRLYPIFLNDKANPGIDELEEAFSVEKVTNEFFQQYCEKYHQLREYLETNEDFKQEAEIRGFTSEQFAKKLLGQIVFMYFIQKKGWLGVGVWPEALTEKEYNKVFYTSGAVGRVIKEYLPKIYMKQGEIYLFKGLSALEAIPDEAEKDIADYMVNQKKWGTGDKKFVRTLYKWAIRKNKNFFDTCLEPLFYQTLNQNRGERAYCTFLHCRIPFLNGGLFEELDGYDWKNNKFNIPNELFSNSEEKGRSEADGILDIFDRYNFTMNEDEPMEREVAIDPEMLGKVFENLLDVSDRKSKGAFYTPREIVHYMCQETLINYLVNQTGISENAIRDFMVYGEYFRDEDTVKTLKVSDGVGKYHYEIDKSKELQISSEIFSFKNHTNRLKEIDDLLANVKVADLAVGSGAFPLGMLNEIVRIRNVLTEYMSIDMSKLEKLAFINYGRKAYDLKINTIKNCIFACDIEPSAVDIAKLRLWLSIVIEDEIGEKDVNDGISNVRSKPRQLPNLDCNIICGNSLVDEFMGHKLISESDTLGNTSINYQRNIFTYGVDNMVTKLIELQKKLFFTKEHVEKEDIKKEIQEIYDNIILEQLQMSPEATKAYQELLVETSKPFVLWQLYFPEIFRDKGGFDIIIGNPPYGANLGENIKKYCIQRFNDVHTRTVDSFNFFISLSLKLIKNDGSVSFIVPNNLLFQAEFEKTRVLLLKRFIKSIINLGDGVFNSASVPTCIYVMQNTLISDYEFAYSDFRYKELKEINWKQVDMRLQVEEILQTDGKIIGISPKATSLMKKINEKSVLLDDLVIDASYGVTTGCDKAFIVNSDVIHTDDLETNYIHKTISGRDIGKYVIFDTDKYVIYMPKTEGNDNSTNIQNHLNKYRDKLDKVSEVKKGIRPWWSNHRARNRELFCGEKIIIRQTGDSIIATYDDSDIFPLDSIMNIKLKEGVDYKFILGCLNSCYFNYLYQSRTQESGRGFAQVKPQNVRALPIPKLSREEKKLISEKVEIILQKKKLDSNADIIEDVINIDNILYNFYGLTSEEIECIKEN